MYCALSGVLSPVGSDIQHDMSQKEIYKSRDRVTFCPPRPFMDLYGDRPTEITLHVKIGIYRCLNSFKPLSQLKENEVVTQISAFLQQSIFPKWADRQRRSKSLLLVLPTVIIHYSNKTYFHHHHRDH